MKIFVKNGVALENLRQSIRICFEDIGMESSFNK